MRLFSNVTYHLSSSLNSHDQSVLEGLLTANGAVNETLQNASHIITDSPEFEGWQSVGDRVAIVTPKWVERSIVLGKCQPTQFYSADPSMLFSGVVACATDIIPQDVEVLTGAICALGGQWRSGLTRDVTHLFALDTTSEKYQTAMHYQKDTRVKIIVPHWFDDVVRLGTANVPTLQYEWPKPQVLQQNDSSLQDTKRSKNPTESQASLFKTTILGESPDHEIPDDIRGAGIQRCNVWKGKNILLSTTLNSSPGRLEAIKVGIVRFGGVVIDIHSPREESSKVEEADVLITRYRSGAAYIKALKSKEKLVGSLSWLFHVHMERVITPPTDQLLHYPIPEVKIPDFDRHLITITNYTGSAREYLKRLIEVMGGKFTASMSPKNTVLIAAFMLGDKTDRAQHWSIPIVNHTWLEDCFVRWKDLTVGLEKYIKFPQGIDFSAMLGDKGVGRKVLLEGAELDVPESSDPSSVMEVHMNTLQSSAKEVEEAIRIDSEAFDNGGDVVMADAPGPDNETTVQPGDVPDIGPEDDSMQSSLPPPPKKLIRRAGTKLLVADTPDELPIISKPKSDKKISPIGTSKTQTVVYGKKKRTARENVVGRVVEHSPLKEGRNTISNDEDSTTIATSKISSRAQTSSAQVEPGDATDDQCISPVRISTKSKSKSTDYAGPEAGRRSLHNTPVKSQVKDKEEGPTADAVSSRRKISTTITKPPTMSVIDSPLKQGPAPQHLLSVVVPPLPDYATPKTNRRTSLRKEPSLHVKAAEAIIPNGKRGSTSPIKRRSKKAKMIDGEEESHDQISVQDTPIAGPSRLVETETEASGTRSRRSAASKASQKLRDVIMPDVVNFEKELRKGAVINEWEHKSKGKGTESNLKKRLSAARDDESEEDKQVERKRPRVNKARNTPDEEEVTEVDKNVKRHKKAPLDHAEDDDVVSKEKRTKAHNSKKITRASESEEDEGTRKSTDPADIRLMTTKVQLSDDVAKALSKLGVKTTNKPSECTHLIAKGFGRTEKILCAIAVCPYILREEWAIQSAAKKRIQPEKDFFLTDEEVEAKYNFTMEESLRRAGKNGGKLLKDKIFYVTPKVKVDIKLLKNIVVAHGGQLLHQVPTIRILNSKDNRFTISCEDDISIWRSLAEQGHPIYSKELLLTGILTQKMDWDDVSCKVVGSY